MKDLGPAKQISVMSIAHYKNSRKLYLSQERYIKKAKFGVEVAGKSGRNERIATKPRRSLLESMHTHHMEPCVRILALGSTPKWQIRHICVCIRSFDAYA
ncbi:hypothetical protein PIB30_017655 [Stylosanthes scabra]|uniref:Retrovirus-related Pol polyprotein from transposon TNT 1-94 n=1 Tax=Stylosanthes scabra TaxID=79078 RepID=A0ABU6X570_9FABA|nr:hypothetical protein [Stylosanthes scabra]